TPLVVGALAIGGGFDALPQGLADRLLEFEVDAEVDTAALDGRGFGSGKGAHDDAVGIDLHGAPPFPAAQFHFKGLLQAFEADGVILVVYALVVLVAVPEVVEGDPVDHADVAKDVRSDLATGIETGQAAVVNGDARHVHAVGFE